jgi:hypothetical protein
LRGLICGATARRAQAVHSVQAQSSSDKSCKDLRGCGGLCLNQGDTMRRRRAARLAGRGRHAWSGAACEPTPSAKDRNSRWAAAHAVELGVHGVWALHLRGRRPRLLPCEGRRVAPAAADGVRQVTTLLQPRQLVVIIRDALWRASLQDRDERDAECRIEGLKTQLSFLTRVYDDVARYDHAQPLEKFAI